MKLSKLFFGPVLVSTFLKMMACGGPDALTPDEVTRDTEPPTIHIVSPLNNSTISRRMENIIVDARDNNQVSSVEFFLDGKLLGASLTAPFDFEWNTRGQKDTTYALSAVAYDPDGNTAIDSVSVEFSGFRQFDEDIIAVTEISVKDLYEGNNTALEVEVHLLDSETNQFLGCSGQLSGLRHVDRQGTLYAVKGVFQKPPSGTKLLTYGDIRDRNLYLQVIEDDYQPCPTPFSIPPDDNVGTSPVFSGTQLLGSIVMNFARVSRIKLEKLSE